MKTRLPAPLAAVFLTVALLLSACDDPSSSNTQGLKSSIYLKIVDASTNQPIEGARILLVGAGEAESDADGQASLEEIKTGGYFLRVAKEGFEPSEEAFETTTKGELAPIPVTTSKTVALHRLGVTLKGRLLVRPDRFKAESQAAANVKVELRLSGNFVNFVRTAKTDAKGDYTFDSLPELTPCQLRVPEFTVAGKKFRSALAGEMVAELLSGDVFSLPMAVLAPSEGGSFMVLSNTTAALVKGKHLAVQFSAKVDTASLGAGSVLLQAGGVNIAAEIAWADDFSTLLVKPYGSDWNSGTHYILYLANIYDVQGGLLRDADGQPQAVILASLGSSSTNDFKVTGLRLQATIYNPLTRQSVDTNVVDYGTSTYQLFWNNVDGATGYEIYSRESADSAWIMENVIVAETQYTINLFFASPKPFFRQHMILARGDKLSTSFAGAAVLTVRDGVKPTLNTTYTSITPLSYGFNTSLNNYGGATRKTVTYEVYATASGFSFSQEPLDTTRTPVVSILEGGTSLFGSGDAGYVAKAGRFKWTGTNTGAIEVEVEPGRDGTYDSLIVDFSKVQDMSGNPFDTSAGAPVIKYLLY